ncbi:MAG: sulfatase-like hydrolase/transferase [bacterium]|nr:sulfatase-like hydrolase/transferase [bacterium]
MTRITRRRLLQTSAAAAAGAAMPRRAFSIARGQTRPNIILIMADDMGYSDLGCYGSEIHTPNIDRLAQGGVRFTRFYNAARCCPTRASLLTGLYPHQAGVGHMINDLGVPAYQGYLNDRCVTIAEAIGASGYQTAMAGKWHVGEQRPHWPCDRGFDRYYGLLSGACNYWKLDDGRGFARNNTPIHNLGPGHYMTDAFADNAIRFVREMSSEDAPYFLYLPFTSPHWPLHAHPADIEKYRGSYQIGWDELRRRRYARMRELGAIDERWALCPREEQNPAWEDAENHDWQDARMAVYAAQIECMDRNIGRLLDEVRAAGDEENTLVMFLCDNGGCHEGRPGNDPAIMPGPRETFQSYGRAWAQASNTPFRKYKHWVHEGGCSTPLVAYWPERIQGGTITHEAGHIIDLLPTCLDAAGGEYPETYQGRPVQPTEGLSLLPVFENGERKAHEALYWEHMGNCAIQKDGWKLVKTDSGAWELYYLDEDRSELNDLAASNGDRARELQSDWQRWADRVGVVPWDELRKK